MALEPSILKSVKKNLNIAAADTSFDQDVMTHINSAFFVLNQIGVGPRGGFMVDDDEDSWTAFIGSDINLNAVKTFVYLSVRLVFDPPSTSYHIAAIKEQIEELLYRLKTDQEVTRW